MYAVEEQQLLVVVKILTNDNEDGSGSGGDKTDGAGGRGEDSPEFNLALEQRHVQEQV